MATRSTPDGAESSAVDGDKKSTKPVQNYQQHIKDPQTTSHNDILEELDKHSMNEGNSPAVNAPVDQINNEVQSPQPTEKTHLLNEDNGDVEPVPEGRFLTPQKRKAFYIMVAGMICLFIAALLVYLVMYSHHTSSFQLTTTTTTATTTTAATTTATTTTTEAPQPSECQNVINFTQSWRMDHNGSNITPGVPHSDGNGYACDLYDNTIWFRFTGDAGNMMMNKAVPGKSCGAFYPLWTDFSMPAAIGVPTRISFYITKDMYVLTGEVMRCSNTFPDVVYRYTGAIVDPCYYAFCGMNFTSDNVV